MSSSLACGFDFIRTSSFHVAEASLFLPVQVSGVLYNQWFAAVDGHTDNFMNDALSSVFGLSREEVNRISHPTAPVTDRSASEDIAAEIGKSDEAALLELVEKVCVLAWSEYIFRKERRGNEGG